MKHITFWFDPISPFAHLAFEQLPQALEGLSVSTTYRPILLAGLLRHWGPGMTLVRREYPTDIGPVDLLCRDIDGVTVAV